MHALFSAISWIVVGMVGIALLFAAKHATNPTAHLVLGVLGGVTVVVAILSLLSNPLVLLVLVVALVAFIARLFKKFAGKL